MLKKDLTKEIAGYIMKKAVIESRLYPIFSYANKISLKIISNLSIVFEHIIFLQLDKSNYITYHTRKYKNHGLISFRVKFYL